MNDTRPSPTIGLGRVAFRGRCPACGRGKLYSGLLKIAPACSACGLSFARHEQGDGPAFFAILIVGAATAIGAAVLEIKYEPPFWLHAMIWVPFVLIASLLSLRWLKAALIGVQYHLRKDDFT